MRLLGRVKEEPPEDKSDALHLLFSAAKLVDYLLTLQTPEFQMYAGDRTRTC